MNSRIFCALLILPLSFFYIKHLRLGEKNVQALGNTVAIQLKEEPDNPPVTLRATGIAKSGLKRSSRPWTITLIDARAKGPHRFKKVNLPYQTTHMLPPGEFVNLTAINNNVEMGELRLEVVVEGRVMHGVQGGCASETELRYRIPAPGATASCRDYSWSYAARQQGSCKGHAGVDMFYRPDGSIDYNAERWRAHPRPLPQDVRRLRL